MAKVKPEWYKSAYNKLYAFLRNNHLEILQEYREYLNRKKQQLEQISVIIEEDFKN